MDAHYAPDSFAKILRSLEYLRTPSLESLQVNCTGVFNSESRRHTLFRRGRGAPSLRSVALHGTAMIVHPPPLQSATSLTIGPTYEVNTCFPVSDILDLLEASSSCRQLVMELDSPLDSVIVYTLITMDSLRSLEVKTDSAGSGIAICDLIDAPSLETLVLDVDDGDLDDLSSGIYVTPVPQKFPHSIRFKLRLANLEDSRLVDVCDAFPSASQICVYSNTTLGSGADEDVVMNLLLFLVPASGTGTVNWPRLQCVTMLPWNYPRHMDPLCQVISSRISAGHPIPRFEIPLRQFKKIRAHRLDWLRDRAEIRCV